MHSAQKYAAFTESPLFVGMMNAVVDDKQVSEILAHKKDIFGGKQLPARSGLGCSALADRVTANCEFGWLRGIGKLLKRKKLRLGRPATMPIV